MRFKEAASAASPEKRTGAAAPPAQDETPASAKRGGRISTELPSLARLSSHSAAMVTWLRSRDLLFERRSTLIEVDLEVGDEGKVVGRRRLILMVPSVSVTCSSGGGAAAVDGGVFRLFPFLSTVLYFVFHISLSP